MGGRVVILVCCVGLLVLSAGCLGLGGDDAETGATQTPTPAETATPAETDGGPDETDATDPSKSEDTDRIPTTLRESEYERLGEDIGQRLQGAKANASIEPEVRSIVPTATDETDRLSLTIRIDGYDRHSLHVLGAAVHTTALAVANGTHIDAVEANSHEDTHLVPRKLAITVRDDTHGEDVTAELDPQRAQAYATGELDINSFAADALEPGLSDTWSGDTLGAYETPARYLPRPAFDALEAEFDTIRAGESVHVLDGYVTDEHDRTGIEIAVLDRTASGEQELSELAGMTLHGVARNFNQTHPANMLQSHDANDAFSLPQVVTVTAVGRETHEKASVTVPISKLDEYYSNRLSADALIDESLLGDEATAATTQEDPDAVRAGITAGAYRVFGYEVGTNIDEMEEKPIWDSEPDWKLLNVEADPEEHVAQIHVADVQEEGQGGSGNLGISYADATVRALHNMPEVNHPNWVNVYVERRTTSDMDFVQIMNISHARDVVAPEHEDYLGQMSTFGAESGLNSTYVEENRRHDPFP